MAAEPEQGEKVEVPPALSAVLALVRPFERFLDHETRSGTLLIGATIAALLWANLAPTSYDATWGTYLEVTLGGEGLRKPVLIWINDLLMAVFFLVVGLEIKRELLAGELASPRRAILPVAAALGGMIVPAAIYWSVAGGTVAAGGWGVPMATDIAFAIGVARLLGNRVPPSILVFLTALAIIDDLGAVLVIAIFYGHGFHWDALGGAALVLGVLIAMNFGGVRRASMYTIVGLVLWYMVLKSGIHATVAGVLVGLTVPANSAVKKGLIVEDARTLVGIVEDDESDPEDRKAALQTLEHRIDAAQSPLVNLEHALHPYVAYAIIPLFALANAGVDLRGASFGLVLQPAALGVVLGLVFGKPIGIVAASWLAVKTGLADLPERANWLQLLGAGLLGGIGFTMSLFIASLAFEPGSDLHDQAKFGILLASVLAAVGGALVLRSGRAPA